MRVKLCYTKDQGCEKDIVALKGLRLPKRLCPLGIGQLPVPDFSLSKWMEDKIDGPVLKQWTVELLKSELKLSSYLNDPMCQRDDLFPETGNWNVKGKKNK
ncbi:uncharacterized protein LOC144627269 [Crassostrea virginica]